MNIFIFKDRNNTSAGYIQVTEDELQEYKRNTVEKIYLINLGHSVMEVDEVEYYDFYKEENREQYRQKLAIKNNVVSMESLIADGFNECNLIAYSSEPLDEKVEREMMIEKLPEAISTLTEEENELIQQLYFNHLSERDLASVMGVPRTMISYRKEKVLRKLKIFFEN